MGQKERFYADVMAMHPEVTGSCNLVIVKLPNGETIRFIVDCGLFQEKEYNELNQSFPFNADKIDFCLVTHNHVDHIGRLPLLVKKGFYNSIYTTETTSKLLPLALADACKVLRDVAKRKNQKCLYEEEHVSQALSHIKPCKYNETIYAHPNVRVTFLPNGHLMGSALILVQISFQDYDDINLLFTGDYRGENMFFDVPSIPEWILALPLTVIQESTYGNINTDIIVECFKDNIKKYINKGGTVVTPVFSLGRTQEILYTLKSMQDSGELSEEIPIYLDGKLAIKYTEMYLNDGLDVMPQMRNFLPKNLTFVNKMNRNNVLESTECKVILTTSGMGSYGPAQVYIPEYITRKDSIIHFTGYTAEGTLGAKLKTTKIGEIVEIGGLLVKKSAEYTSEFSAHAKADEMIAFLKQFKDLKIVLVNHGATATKEIFAARVLSEVGTKNVGILGRDYFFRVCPYGFVKTLPSNFK